MKRIGISIVSALLVASGMMAQKSVVVTNTSALARAGELVEVKSCCKKDCKLTKPFILKDNAGKEVGYQLIYNSQKEVTGFVFQANVKAKSSATYWIKAGTPTPTTAKTFGRFVPERKDDFAWENDFAAYRMYGPALAKELLERLGFETDISERVQYLIAHHHTYSNIDGIDYQILVEADFLVNMYEDGVSKDAVLKAYNNIFKTKYGKYICKDMFLID
jgi:hypothetical protein